MQLKQDISKEIGLLNLKYANSDFVVAGGTGAPRLVGSLDTGRLNQLLARNLEIGYKNSLGIDGKAEDIIRQNMMINSIKDFNNKSDLYGYTRAASNQNSNWAISGELAKEYLPLLLNIIKALIYASFIFIVPLMILSGGMDKYLKYCVVVFSLQIWPALNSVLNLFIELYSHLKGSGITGGELTYGNFNEAGKAVDTIILVASGLQMSIPFLSFAIVQGGVQSFVHLAGSVQAASNSAAAGAASEVISGIRTFDAVSLGSQNIDQKSCSLRPTSINRFKKVLFRCKAQMEQYTEHSKMVPPPSIAVVTMICLVVVEDLVLIVESNPVISKVYLIL
jgi:hypothetical protein